MAAETQLEFRPATSADLPFLTALRHATMSEHLARVNAARDDAAQLARILFQFEHAQIVSIAGKQIGLLKAYREPGQWYIAQIQIAPEFQGRGLGRSILDKVLTQASNDNLPTVLRVFDGNPAKKLYEAKGFKEIGQDGVECLMSCPPA
ncbi:ribosomal protein S18 acetylase RimI-like enzyme [Collimonas sp. PA-H2]|uniref:GNAT family N-acetyltransferase n=1 Tax=Collimonas sp. PA-H2 TaxID=1881062 RepID=UPI000BF40C9F|nr:GNAT family N-acetyltransferase [Collimonas sp. PA-H2]PFH07712.1 ribosomal protein S18 acetylase RimI-like enzyme [Collimonas sp. PA-H2]